VTNPEYLLPELLGPLVRNTIFSGNIHHCVQADSTNSIALRGAALAGQQRIKIHNKKKGRKNKA